ncbi:MAG: RNA polymerase sigma factor RpoD/SigA [Bacteroidales bacterium]|nr:RNA polymerase sigma factor RpoD/SigA [Bacteroidales bacterium]MBQ7532392.1 RNA polymerase sigma factor RpoD/SigA [Bacteroidales bacterium]
MRQLKISKSITNREQGALDKYLADIAKEPMITPDEEVELAQKIKMGDQIALDRLVRANLRFVVSVAKQYQNQGLSLADLINEGNVGLIKAAQRFDETKGFKFISYAVWWIRQAILQAVAEQSRMVRLPLNQVGFISRVKKTASYLEQLYQRKPTIKEIADELDMPEEKVETALKVNAKEVSMDAPVSSDDDMTFIDTVIPEDNYDADRIVVSESESAAIKRSLSVLNEKERKIIIYYFGLDSNKSYSLEEIGNMMDMTRERVRQVKDKALKKLRTRSKKSLLNVLNED